MGLALAPSPAPPSATVTASEPQYAHLLDFEPELAARLRDDDRAEARQRLRVRISDVPIGEWTLPASAGGSHPFGLLIVAGMLLQEVRLAGRRALELLGPGDVVLPHRRPTESLDVALSWTAAVPSRVAILDDRLQPAFALWPGLAVGLIERTGRQLGRLAVHAAIAQLPRVDQRLEAMFWDLADRWGRVTPSGIHVPLPLPHEVLGRLVGGRRSTITLALSDLADRGIVTRRPDRTWLLHGTGPTLPAEEHDVPTAPLLAPIAAPASAPSVEPWQPAARRELLDTAARIRAGHTEQQRRLADSLRNAERLRAHSTNLRRSLDAQRQERDGLPIGGPEDGAG
jgi:CRP/FNR family cyclic AMP-dependent transcriptional regulator